MNYVLCLSVSQRPQPLECAPPDRRSRSRISAASSLLVPRHHRTDKPARINCTSSPPRSAAPSRAMSAGTRCGASPTQIAEDQQGRRRLSSPTTVGYGPAGGDRTRCSARSSPMSRRCRSRRDFHDTRGLGIAQRAGRGLQRQLSRVRRLARRARGCPTRRAPPATSSWRTLHFLFQIDGLRDGHRSRPAGRRCARSSPGRCRKIALYGAIAKAGAAARNFHLTSASSRAGRARMSRSLRSVCCSPSRSRRAPWAAQPPTRPTYCARTC